MKLLYPQRMLALLLTIIVVCCNIDDGLEISKESSQPREFTEGVPTVLGEKLEIPFTVAIMQKAYDNLKNNESLRKIPRFSQMDEDLEIKTSHFYYRFLPKDSLQYERLVNDTILFVSNVPFEYDIEVNGDYYKDPSLKDTDFTYYYSTFPVDYEFPNDIAHEKLADLYFPPEDEIENPEEGELVVPQTMDKTSIEILNNHDEGFFELLETEALRITDNLEEDELAKLTFLSPDKKPIDYNQAKTKGYATSTLEVYYPEEFGWFKKRKKWYPHGRVTVEEGALTNLGSNNNIVGVQGVEIRVRKWGFLVIRRTTTDLDGNFKTSGTRTKRVKYAAYFKNPYFIIKAGTIFWNARDRGHRRHKRSGWFRHYDEGGRSHLYALVHNAAFDYYHRVVPEYGLRRPKTGIKISAKYDRCATAQHRAAVLTLLPTSRIRITRKNEHCNYRQSDGIYAATVHELAHAGHQRMDPGMFSIFESGSKNRLILKESWAEGVETIVTNDRYDAITNNNYQSSNLNDQNGRWNSWRQRRYAYQMDEYTPIVEDLIDDFNQFPYSNDSSGRTPIDNVNGYNLNQIQSAINNCRDINCWKEKLNNRRPSGVTTDELDRLFDYVHYIRKHRLD